MTERAIPDLAALLNGGEPMTPQAEQALADAMADALARGATARLGAGADARHLGAQLEGALPQVERNRMLEALARDPEGLAELESAQALLETVQAAPHPRSATRIAAAQAILQAAQPQRVSWFSRLKLGSPRRAIPVFGALAAAAICAVVIVPAVLTPKSNVSGGAPEAASAFTQKSGSAPATDWFGASTDEGHSGGWSAFALSAKDRRYGVTTRAASEDEAGDRALAACRQAGGDDCVVSAKIQGQCLSTAAASPEPPVTVSGPDAVSATKAALSACHDDICKTVKTICPQL